jgi:hypothetical protein
MKRMVILAAILMFVVTSHAQITLEHNYPASATLTELSISGYKYYVMDVTNNQCKIYNMDHSLWKTISLSVPANMYLYDIKYVSEGLFNSDSKVELAYIYYSYDTTYYYYSYYARVINESGLELMPIPGCGYLDLKETPSNGTKFFAYVYNYSIYPSTVNTLVYSVPGELPTGGIPTRSNDAGGYAYPNPARDNVTIPYRLPEGVETAQILLFNGSGQLARTFDVDRSFDHVMIQTSELPKGIYYYQVKSGSVMISTGRVIHE